MADMLKLADSISVIGFKIGRGTLNRESRARLRELLGDRTYLMDIVERMADRHQLSIRSLPIPEATE